MQIAVVEGGVARRIAFDPALYDYGSVPPPQAGAAIDFAGFRGLTALNQPETLTPFVIFAGASYFQAIARNQLFGMSARGLAIGTGEPEGEEFPFFAPTGSRRRRVTGWWCTRCSTARAPPGLPLHRPPRRGHHDRRRGDDLRPPGDRPPRPGALTSMFLFDAKDRGEHDDFRLGVHDSDGLAIWNGSDERLWRPLHAPRLLQISAFSDSGPRGFGLVQRERRFQQYEDLAARFDRRPSVWVEPIGDWGRGHIVLVEIPTTEEVHDNIVAYWRPRDPGAGGRRDLADLPPALGLGRARSGRAAAGFADLSGDASDERRRFVVDFAGDGQPVTRPSAVQLSAEANPGIAAQRADLRESRDRRPPPALRPRPRRQRPGRAARRPALGRPPDRRDLDVPMESVTLPAGAGARRSAGAAAAAGAAGDAEQSLARFDWRGAAACPASRARLARAFLFVGAILLTAVLVHQMWLVLSIGGLTGVEKAMLGLFVINIAWVGFGAVSPLMGFMLGPEHAAPPDAPAPVARTALLMPTYNEDPARIVGAASDAPRHRRPRRRCVLRPLHPERHQPPRRLARRAGGGRRGPRRPGDRRRLHYRHRGRNLRRKASNIADWVERWGAAYPFMLVLDADSLMEAGTVIELARRMEADDTLGILQTSPHLIGGETPLARASSSPAASTARC